MGRKRKSVPERLDPTKQRRLAWNLSDLGAEGFKVIADNDPSLQLEAANAEYASPKAGTSSAGKASSEVSYNDLLTLRINQCEFYIKVRQSTDVKENESHCLLGSFYLEIPIFNEGSHEELPGVLPAGADIWFYVSSTPNKHLIYFESEDTEREDMVLMDDKKVMYFQASTDVSFNLLEGLQLKAFNVVVGDYNADKRRLEIKILATEAAIMQLQFSSEGIRSKKINVSLQVIMSELHGFHVPDHHGQTVNTKHDVSEFFSAIKARHAAENLRSDINVQHTNLRPRLRQYQKDAVRWMLHREKVDGEAVKPDPDQLHSLYEEFRTEDGHLLYYNRHGGYLVRKKPLCVEAPPGGILADEMGLGKTVEVLACMMAHPRRDLPALEELPVILPDSESSSDEEEDLEKGTGVKDSNISNGGDADEKCLTQDANKADELEIEGTGKEQGNTGGDTKEVTPTCSGDGAALVVKEDISGETIPGPVVIQLDHDYCAGGKSEAEERTTTEKQEEDKKVTEDTPPKKGRKKPAGKSNEKPKTRRRRKTSDQAAETEKSGNQPTESDVAAEKNDDILQEDSVVGTSFDTGSHNSTKEEDVSESTDSSKKERSKRKRVGYVIVTEEEEEEEVSGATYFGQTSVKPKEAFECICGLKSSVEAEKDEKSRVQCLSCGLWQHPECVKYDLTDAYRGPYLCPHCHVVSTPVPSGATLIISPNSICHQWVDEIRKHIHQARLKVLVYGGVHSHGFLQPQFLARHDIVITTYETLQKEINYVDLPHSNSQAGRRFRHPKRFMAIPSPIIAVEWWRICLDEAQMVECTTTKSAEMALRLSAVNRWCVTGTPIQKGLNDLYGLMLFLGEDPYWVQTWWHRLLHKPYTHGIKQPMHDAVAKVMWRTCKSDVIDQICLPTQSEEVHWLTFSPVEEHFYKRTFSQCARVGLNSLSKWPDGTTKLNSVDRYTLHSLLGPLTKIRQACCHPQAVRGSFLPIQKSTMTMEELLVSMTKKARLECEEAHRQLVASMNGLAGLHIIHNKHVEAVDMYREVLRSIVEHGTEFRTDPLQQLHTLHNLREVLSQRPPGVAPTLRDDKLEQEAKDLRHTYLVKAASFVNQAQEAWSPLRASLRQLRADLGQGDDWWADLLQWIIYIGTDELLIERVKTELLDNRTPGTVSLASSFRDARGLEYVVAGELEGLDSAHETLIDSLRALQGAPSTDLINQTVECCLRPALQPLKVCPFCKANELFDDYENKLFSFTDKGVSEVSGLEGESLFQVGTRRQGTWADSETERILKTLISFAKGYGGTPKFSDGRKLVDLGSIHLKIFDALKKEFKVVRTLWIELRAQVSAHDELDMATTRLRLRLPDEPVPDPPQPNILEPAELDSQRLKVQSDRIIAQNQLRKMMGQLMYLKNLAKVQTGMESGENPEPCPICQRTLGKKWAVLSCGHCYCLDCVRVLVTQCSVGGVNARLKCPMCRQLTRYAEISYVSTGVERQQEETPIKGDHSTKMEGVVRCVLHILKDDPATKILIFTMWQNVLTILAKALEDNDVNYVSLLANNKFQKNLTSFKTLDSISVLLLPVHSGANGLNLIEATHVLLVEPILNPSQELQAIGRIHRIGQTKPTFVHRFLVRGTIEERLHHLLAVRTPAGVSTNHADDTPFTISDLRALYLQSQRDHPDGEQGQDAEEDMVFEVDDMAGQEVREELMVEDTAPVGPMGDVGDSGEGSNDQGPMTAEPSREGTGDDRTAPVGSAIEDSTAGHMDLNGSCTEGSEPTGTTTSTDTVSERPGVKTSVMAGVMRQETASTGRENEGSTTDRLTKERPIAEGSTTERPTTDMLTSNKPTTDTSTTERPTYDGTTTERPTTDRSTTEGPTTDKTISDSPTTEGSSAERPTRDRTTAENPTTDMSTTERPTTGSTKTERPLAEGATLEGPTTDGPEVADIRP